MLFFPERLLAEGEIITRIEVNGNRRIETDAILSNVKSRVGDYYSRSTVSEDIKRVFRMGYFDDVKVEHSTGDLGPQLTFIVKERAFIREIKIEGNKELKEETVNDVITVRDNTIFNMERVKESKNKIRELYEEKGYFLADISHRLDELGDEAVLVFEIAEGRKVRVKKINLLGNSRIGDKKLRKIMETTEGGVFSWLTDSGKFEEDTLQKDIELLTAFYYNNGFVQVRIEEPHVFMSPDKKWLYVTIRIREGLQFRVGTIDFTGDLAGESGGAEEIKETLKIKEGEIFSRDKLRSDIVTLTDRFGDRGYAFANVSPRTEIDSENRLVNITFDAVKGNLIYIERINIYGNTKTRDKVIRRELKIKEGDLYNGSAIRRSRQRVFNLGYFKDVNLTTKKGSGEDKLDIDIEVEEGPTGTLTVGAGYSSVDGLVGMIQVSQGNLFGRGQKLSLSAEFGGVTKNYSLSFTEPYLFDTTLSAGFDIFHNSRDYTDYSSLRKGWGIRLGKPIGEYSRVNLKYRFEEVEISDVAVSAPAIIQEAEGTTKTSSITATLSRDTRDNYLSPSTGSVNSISIEYAGGILGQDNNFYKVIGNSTWYFPTPWEHVFMVRGRVGYAEAFEGDELNIDDRFFLGGINTLRGFEYRSVGPEEGGFVVGGNKEVLLNVEYLFDISREAGLKGLLFFDTGNAFTSWEGLRESVGYGVRWYSPIGPLRLEWGHVLDPKPGEKKSRWEFSIGTFF